MAAGDTFRCTDRLLVVIKIPFQSSFEIALVVENIKPRLSDIESGFFGICGGCVIADLKIPVGQIAVDMTQIQLEIAAKT